MLLSTWTSDQFDANRRPRDIPESIWWRMKLEGNAGGKWISPESIQNRANRTSTAQQQQCPASYAGVRISLLYRQQRHERLRKMVPGTNIPTHLHGTCISSCCPKSPQTMGSKYRIFKHSAVKESTLVGLFDSCAARHGRRASLPHLLMTKERLAPHETSNFTMSKMPRQEIASCTPSMVLSTSICRIDSVESHDGNVSIALALTLEVFQKMSTVPPAPSPDSEPKSLPMAVRLLDLAGCWGQTHEMMSAVCRTGGCEAHGCLADQFGSRQHPEVMFERGGEGLASGHHDEVPRQANQRLLMPLSRGSPPRVNAA